MQRSLSNIRRNRLIPLATLMTIALSPVDLVYGGSCVYLQQAPKIRAWVHACLMPMTEEACKEEAVKPFKSDVRYVDAPCSEKGIVGTCNMPSGIQMVLYGRSEQQLSTGCQQMKGTWRTAAITKDRVAEN